jgi:antitoxin component YwqK of YwqJK toxin-antitoxin module
MFRRLCAVASAVAVCVLAFPAHAARDCEMNGERVNPDNGSTYAGKTGMMKCVDRDSGKVLLEEEYRNGRAIGYRKRVDLFGGTSIGTYNEQGNREGEYKEFDPAGNLVAEERYANGANSGIQVHYHKNRQVQRRAFSVPGKGSIASIEYNDRGQITELRCADKPVLGEDRALCGFDGKPSDVLFYKAKGEPGGQARFEAGKRVSMTAIGAGGTVSRSEEVQGERRTLREHYPEGQPRLETVVVGNRKESERELARSGQPVRDSRWNDGYKMEETLWYLNGQPKSKTRWERSGNQVLVKAEEFWDNGKPRARTVSEERRGPVGVQQTFTEGGVLESESTYELGKLARRKSYKDGRLVSDEEYFEDGSRKSLRKAD